MKNTLSFNGYFGSIEISPEDNILHGELLFIRPLVTYEAETAKELEDAFKESVTDYLLFCEKQGIEPTKPCKGSLNIRLGKNLHLSAAVMAHNEATSLNDLIKNAVSEKIQRLSA